MLLAAGALGTLACDESIEVENQPPAIHIEGWCTAGDQTYLVIDVVDLEGDPVDLSICAPAGAAVVTGSAGDGFDGLSSDSDEPGRRHLVEWADRADPSPCPCPRARGGSDTSCRATPTGNEAPALELLAGDVDHPIDAVASLVRLAEVDVPPLGACP